MTDAVMLFAAGFGTRMGALTQDRPKPLIDVNGMPLIDHCLHLAREFGAKTIVANAHYKAEMIVDHLAGAHVTVHVETPDILDTGGGLKAALPLLDAETVFTMNTDAIWKGPNPFDVLQKAWTDDMQALMLCVPKSNAVGHSGSGDIVIDQNGRARFGDGAIYTGLQIIRTKTVSDMAESVFSLKLVWADLVQNDQLRAVLYPGRWCDVGHPAGIALAETMLKDADV